MTMGAYLRRYFKSPLGIANIGFSLSAGFLGPGERLASNFLWGGAAFMLFGLAVLLSGLGPKAAAREAEREAGAKGRARRAEASAYVSRLERLRLVDPEVAKIRDYLVLEARRSLDLGKARSSEAEGDFGPVLGQILRESLALIQSWLREIDETAAEKRFDRPDAHAFPEAKARILAALGSKVQAVQELRDETEVPAEDILAADEELR